jgi:hypothetical protein
MDALESVFVPYRDVLAPKVVAPTPSKWRWFWVAVVAVLGVMALWMLTRSKPSALKWISNATIDSAWSAPAATQKAILVPHASHGPSLASIPQSISLIRGGASDAVAPSTPQELAKQVGLAVKQTLLTFPSLTPEIVASIVQHTVRSILAAGRIERTKDQETTKEQASLEPPRAQAPQGSKPQGGRVSVRGLPVPVVDEADAEAQEAGSKQKKINADSDPAVLRLMKERGLDVKST